MNKNLPMKYLTKCVGTLTRPINTLKEDGYLLL